MRADAEPILGSNRIQLYFLEWLAFPIHRRLWYRVVGSYWILSAGSSGFVVFKDGEAGIPRTSIGLLFLAVLIEVSIQKIRCVLKANGPCVRDHNVIERRFASSKSC